MSKYDTKYNLKTEIRVWDEEKMRHITRIRNNEYPLSFEHLFEKMRVQLEMYKPMQVRFTVSIAS